MKESNKRFHAKLQLARPHIDTLSTLKSALQQQQAVQKDASLDANAETVVTVFLKNHSKQCSGTALANEQRAAVKLSYYNIIKACTCCYHPYTCTASVDK